MRSLFFLPLILLFGIGCNQKTATTSSGSINSEAPFLWEGAPFPKDVKISAEYMIDPADEPKIRAMAAAWDTAMNNHVNFFNFTGTTPEKANASINPNQLRDNILGIYKATTWPYPEYPDALAITQIFAIRYNQGDSNEYVAIQEADILVNYENFSFDTGGFDYDFQTVLLHEMGHFLGLQHKPRSYPRANSVMYPSIYSYEIKQVPQTVDKQDLSSKYNITLPLTAGGSGISNPSNVTYSPNSSDAGEPVKVILELRANGECVHRINGEIVSRH